MFYMRIFSICIFVFTISTVSSDLNELNILPPKREKENSLFPPIETSQLKEKQFPVLRREKRQLVFPIATLLQCSFAVASPVQLKEYNIYVNQGWQLNFILPYNISQFASVFLFGSPVINGRSREKRNDFSHHNLDEKIAPETIIDATTFSDISSQQMYFFIERYLDGQGYNGSGCLLHSICQHATAPFHQDDDLMHEILHFIMTPSEHAAPEDLSELWRNKTITENVSQKYSTIKNPTQINEYLEAEIHGERNEDCDALYTCPVSPLERISEVVYDNNNDYSE